MENLKMSSAPKTITIKLTDDQHKALHALALRHKTSVSLLGQEAITGMLKRSKWGLKPRVKPSTVDNAILMTCLGRELP